MPASVTAATAVVSNGGMTEDPLAEAVEHAKRGDRAALETIVAAITDDVYGLAVRFLGHPDDADDAGQEILVRIITNLRGFSGDSRFRTWAYRVAANHLMNYKRGLRRAELRIEDAQAQLGQAVAASAGAVPTEDSILVEEMKLACAHGMLLCLDREHRMAYVLGVLLDLPGETAAEILEVAPATHRKRLQRARQRMREHLSPLCGLVSEDNPCRCNTMVGQGAAAGIIDPDHLAYASRPRRAQRLKVQTGRLQEATEVLRGYPEYRAPQTFAQTMRTLLERIPELH